MPCMCHIRLQCNAISYLRMNIYIGGLNLPKTTSFEDTAKQAHFPNTFVGRVAQSVQRLATGWTVRGSNPGGGEIFRTCPDWPWGPPSLLYNGYRLFQGGKERPGRDADPSPPPSAVVKKEQSYISIPPMGRTVCTQSQCLYKGELYLTFYKTCFLFPCMHSDVLIRAT